VAPAKLSNREAQIVRHLGRRDRFKRDLARREVGKKVIGIAAVTMDYHPVVSLLRQALSEL
jgi:hypothetical protein